MKNDTLDTLNIKLLKALEGDSRRSLKELASELNIKTSTIYHRLHRLRECKLLEGFSIIVNPEEMKLSVHNFLTVSLKNLNVKRLDRMFVESFAQYLAKEFAEILFVSTSRTKVYVISSHMTTAESEDFLDKIRAIPYVDSVDIVQFDKIIKGHKLFSFNANYFERTQGQDKEQTNREAGDAISDVLDTETHEEDDEEEIE